MCMWAERVHLIKSVAMLVGEGSWKVLSRRRDSYLGPTHTQKNNAVGNKNPRGITTPTPYAAHSGAGAKERGPDGQAHPRSLSENGSLCTDSRKQGASAAPLSMLCGKAHPVSPPTSWPTRAPSFSPFLPRPCRSPHLVSPPHFALLLPKYLRFYPPHLWFKRPRCVRICLPREVPCENRGIIEWLISPSIIYLVQILHYYNKCYVVRTHLYTRK